MMLSHYMGSHMRPQINHRQPTEPVRGLDTGAYTAEGLRVLPFNPAPSLGPHV